MRYAVKRLLWVIPTLFGVVTAAFLLIHLAPGDPATLMMGDYITKENVAIERERLGLHLPLWQQYASYVGRAFTGNLGISFRTDLPVLETIAKSYGNTMALAAGGTIVAALLGIPAGIFSAVRRNTMSDYSIMTLAMVSLSMPNFWFAIVLIYVFSFQLALFPIMGSGQPGDLASQIHYLVLPAVAVGARSAAVLARIVRSSMLDVLMLDYVRTARAKGIGELKIVYKHAFRNAAIPVVVVFGTDLAYLMGGTVIVETVFARPGLGKLVVDAIASRDYPLVQGALVIFAVGIVVINLLVDLACAAIDPRIRYS